MDTFTDGSHQLRVVRGVVAMQAMEAVEDGSQAGQTAGGKLARSRQGRELDFLWNHYLFERHKTATGSRPGWGANQNDRDSRYLYPHLKWRVI
jgi:hypothetical protein